MRMIFKQVTALKESLPPKEDKNAILKTVPQPKGHKAPEEKIQEAKKVAEYFFLLNETNWNKFDDAFYIINRRWFDRWKDFVAYDYIVRKFLIEGGEA